jgi:hypothetical protein
MWRCITVCPAAFPSLMPMLKPVGRVTRDQLATAPTEEREKLDFLPHRGFEKGGDMALRDHQCVAGRNRIAVGEGETELATLQDAFGRQLAERAGAQPSAFKWAQLE